MKARTVLFWALWVAFIAAMVWGIATMPMRPDNHP
jgi:hypothetical protein